MTTEAAQRCNMCETYDMVPVPGKSGENTTFKWCPNCDNPDGKVPKFR